MTSKLLPPGLLALAGAGCLLGAACGGPSEPHGSPVLTQVYWSANQKVQLVWTQPGHPDPALVSEVPPFADEIDFVFDRILDGSRIETIETIDGSVVPVPKTPAAIEVTWPDMTKVMSTPPFALTVDFNSAPLYGGQSSYVFARPQVAGFPSGETLTFELVLSSLTSAYGDIATAPTSIPVVTSAFAVSLDAPATAVATSFELPLAFSNRLPPVPVGGTSPSVHVTAGGTVPYKLVADASFRSRWFLVPADCLGAWPANTTFTVTVDPGLPDAFGRLLAQGATTTFVTGAASGITRDAGCTIGDGGAGDGGVSDASATDGGAADAPDAASSDGGTPDAADAPSDAPSDGGTSDIDDAPASFDVDVDAVAG